MFLQLEAIEKSFDGNPVLRGVTVALAVGEILVLLGPSGCGKTTLLRIAAGLETAEHGRLLLHGRDISHTPVHQRGFGFVFQDYALFPHKNVQENIAFGLRMQKWERERIRARAQEVLALVGLAGFEQRPIHELSGGEQQRVALARSLAPAPALLLLDEPLGALDRALRERLMLELRHILKSAGEMVGRPEGITAVYVTHDQAEAFAIADRVAVMNQGQIEQVDTPQAVYGRPLTPFVARFLGMENILEGQLVQRRPLRAQTAVGVLQLAEREGKEWEMAAPVTLLVRPEAARLAVAETENVVQGTLEELSFRGRYQVATVSMPTSTSPLSFKFEWDTAVRLPPPGSSLTLSLSPGAILPLEGC